jgi:hypothetical protein
MVKPINVYNKCFLRYNYFILDPFHPDILYNHVYCVDGNLTLPFAYDTQQDAHCENLKF